MKSQRIGFQLPPNLPCVERIVSTIVGADTRAWDDAGMGNGWTRDHNWQEAPVMQQPRVWTLLRRIMIAVAIVALVLWANGARQRRPLQSLMP